MDEGHIILIVVLCLLIFMSAFFSATEMAFSTVNKVRLKSLAANGNKAAERVLKLIEKYDRLLSTILIGNNIVNITCSTLATVLFISLLGQDVGVTVSTAVITVIVLIFGEITPKSLAKERPESFAMFSAPILKVFVVILMPVNALFALWKMMLNKIFKFKKNAAITEEELITYVETAQNEGGIDAHESQLIRSAIEFEDLDIDDIIVPRVNVVAIEEHTAMEEIAKLFRNHGFSRLPIYNGTIDSIIGIIHEKDFYSLYHDKKDNISSIIQNSICVAPNMKISKVLRMLQKAKIHMAIVVDEFGGTAGIVTLEDILEELVGEIWDEHDEVEEFYKPIDDVTFLISANANLEDMFENLGINVKEEFDSTTVGGWVTEQMEKIPVIGEKFSYENLDFLITKANSKRVLEIKVKVNPQSVDDN